MSRLDCVVIGVLFLFVVFIAFVFRDFCIYKKDCHRVYERCYFSQGRYHHKTKAQCEFERDLCIYKKGKK